MVTIPNNISQIEAKLIFLTQKYMTAHFPGLAQALQFIKMAMSTYFYGPKRLIDHCLLY
jgi:hypothetical protein